LAQASALLYSCLATQILKQDHSVIVGFVV